MLQQANKKNGKGSIVTPNKAKEWLDKGIAAHRSGDLPQAELAYQEVLKAAPENPDALHYLGLIARDHGHLPQAIDLLARAVAQTPNNAALHYNYALSLQQLGNRELAIKHYQLATQHQENFPQAYNNLGVLLQECGLHKEATRSFRSALRFDPKRAETYYNLSQVQRYHEETDDIVRMQSLLRQPSLPQAEQSKLHFALGKIFDDLGRYEQAFEHFEHANKSSPSYFDSETFCQHVDSIISLFNKDFFATRTGFGSQDTRPTFIVGLPRSGTTLVEQILASHHSVYGAGELEYFNTIANAIPKLTQQPQAIPEGYQHLSPQLSQQIADDYLSHAEQLAADCRIFIDKAPLNFLHLGLLALLFPQAHIIHVQRDPLDTCLSCYFQNFNAAQPYTSRLEDLAAFYQQYQKLMAHWQQHLPLNIHTVQYEQLVQQTETETKKLVEFLGLEWEEQCIEYYKTTRRISTASQWQARQPVYTSSLQRWKNYERQLAALAPLR
jgi:tetratricopeptide (TPR) repeat protein